MEPAAPRSSARRAGALLLWIGLGALGIWLGAPDVASVRTAWDRLAAAPVTALTFVIGGALALVIAEAIRIAVIARVLGARVRARDAFDAAVANHVMTAITPNVGLGEPSVAYVLGRRGIPWDIAVAIPFVKFTSSLALVFALGAVLVAAGLGPPIGATLTVVGVIWFAVIAAIALATLGVATRAATARRLVERIAGWFARRRWFASARWQRRVSHAAEVAARMVDRLAGLRRLGARGVALVTASHLVYYAVYVAPLVGLAIALAAPPVPTLAGRSLTYLCFVFAMPTPGGAGPSEAAAGWFFADLMSASDAIIVVAVFRAATYYLQLAIGLVYLPIAALVRARRPA